MSATGYLIGEYKAYQLRQKCKILNEMIRYLRCVSDNISYKRDELKNMLYEIALRDEFKTLKLHFKSTSSDWPLALEFVLNEAYSGVSYAIAKAEFAFFKSALTQLGRSDAKTEVQMLEYYIKAITFVHSESVASVKTQNKLYRALGLSAGVALGIILM